MIYRLYSSSDFARLYAVEEVCFPPSFRFTRGYLRELVTSPEAATWIVEEDGLMVGFAIVEWGGEADEEIAYIQTIEVAPEQRGRGVGRQLLERIEGSARAVGAVQIGLHVDEANSGAIRLYEANGYRKQGREENYYPQGRAALIYAKALTEGHQS